MFLPLALPGGSDGLGFLGHQAWGQLETSQVPAVMAMSPQGTTVLTVTAMDRDTGVNDKIFYNITSE